MLLLSVWDFWRAECTATANSAQDVEMRFCGLCHPWIIGFPLPDRRKAGVFDCSGVPFPSKRAAISRKRGYNRFYSLTL